MNTIEMTVKDTYAYDHPGSAGDLYEMFNKYRALANILNGPVEVHTSDGVVAYYFESTDKDEGERLPNEYPPDQA